MNQEEKVLRENIRRLIRHVKQKKLNEENDLRVVIQQMMDLELSEGQTPDVDPAPNKSTGINVLEELLKKIIPIIETDYKSLTTNSDQRQSYRAHVLILGLMQKKHPKSLKKKILLTDSVPVLKAMKPAGTWLIKVTRKLKLLFLILMNCCRTLKIKNCFMITLSQI